jgi:hypothetical protein
MVEGVGSGHIAALQLVVGAALVLTAMTSMFKLIKEVERRCLARFYGTINGHGFILSAKGGNYENAPGTKTL